MKVFLGKRGVMQDILKFDPKSMSSKTVTQVSKFIEVHKDSFDPVAVKKASSAATPLASWVQATLAYADVLHKIRPLHEELNRVEIELSNCEAEMSDCKDEMINLEVSITKLKEKFTEKTKESEQRKCHLEDAEAMLNRAEELVGLLEGKCFICK